MNGPLKRTNRTVRQNKLTFYLYNIKQFVCSLWPAKWLDRMGWHFFCGHSWVINLGVTKAKQSSIFSKIFFLYYSKKILKNIFFISWATPGTWSVVVYNWRISCKNIFFFREFIYSCIPGHLVEVLSMSLFCTEKQISFENHNFLRLTLPSKLCLSKKFE